MDTQFVVPDTFILIDSTDLKGAVFLKPDQLPNADQFSFFAFHHLCHNGAFFAFQNIHVECFEHVHRFL